MKIMLVTLGLSLLCVALSFAEEIPAPSGANSIYFPSSDVPSASATPSDAIPIGTGPIATGGSSLTLSVSLEAFAEAVDLYIGFLLPNSSSISILNESGGLQDLSEGLIPWSGNVNQATSRTLFENISTSSLPTGTYRMYLLATPAGSTPIGSDYYLWTSTFENRSTDSGDYAYKFFAEYAIKETNELVCPGPCATTVVPVVRLKIDGGFNIVNDQVSGSGTATVSYNDPCSIDSLGGGGAGWSCSVTGSTVGTFTISGYVTGVTSVTGYGFQPTARLTLTEETPVGLTGTHTWVNPATGVPTVLPLTYHADCFSELLESSGFYSTPFDIPTVVCDGWMTQTLETEVSESFDGIITVPGATGSTRYFAGEGQLFFYKSPFHIDGDVETETTD